MTNRIIVVYDNLPNESIPNLQPGWGFAAYIEWDGKKILFDTGWDGIKLLHNLKELHLSYDYFDAIFISHMHWDHIGGLPEVLNHSKIEQIYLPKGFSEHQGREIEKFGLQVKYMDKFQVLSDISPNIFTTGACKANGPVEEQAMVLQENTPSLLSKYNRMIVGCTHPGLTPFYDAIQPLGDIHELIGGLHGFQDGAFLSSHHTSRFFVGHCTQHKSIFTNLPNTTYDDLHVGLQIL